MVEGLLRQVLVVQPHVAMQCLAEVLGAVEAVRLQHLLEPAVEPFDHAIGAVLADLDTELAAVEARREKTRQLKQGMMQALLTGRIRLT